MENLLKNIEELREKVLNTWRVLDLDRKEARAEELKHEMNIPGFWDNQEKAVEISKQVEELEKEVKVWQDLKNEIISLEELIAIGQEENDDSIYTDAIKQYEELENKYNKLDFYVMFNNKYDKSNAIVSIHAGAGGVDAQDWAEMLMRMLMRFSEKKDYNIEILDKTMGNEAGIKSMTMQISGRYTYGYLKSESGVHRLVRISPFDGDAARHTSFALVEVIPELPEAGKIEIKDEDIRIDVFKSSGPGGQGVNTTDSAIRIKHLPSDIIVTCQNERSQHQNKESAMKILKAKLFKLEEEKKQKTEAKLRGETQKAEWGKQIRSYVMQPYKMVKDHRTKHETQNVDAVLNGDLEEFMEAYLRWNA
ncbi:MAG: peptide chain release factor 2 [Patescibacteria group bacterium]|nr:peptide chain release factor 2 [Patescibacteria group bacterium]